MPKTEQFHVICNESISHRRTILVVEIVRRVKKLPAVELRNGACPLRKETETPRKDINIGQISQSICNLRILNTTTTWEPFPSVVCCQHPFPGLLHQVQMWKSPQDCTWMGRGGDHEGTFCLEFTGTFWVLLILFSHAHTLVLFVYAYNCWSTRPPDPVAGGS